MKTKWFGIVYLIFFACFAQTAFAFESGSTGALGAFNPTTNTEIELPADGILNYTTINIPAGVTVTFKKNAGNTPVYMLATGDVTVVGTISVKGSAGVAIAPGKGGPGGYDGGLGGYSNSCGGIGLGFGGGQAAKQVATTMTYGATGGGGGFGSAGSNGIPMYTANFATGGVGGSAYGNTNLLPMIGGSGGGGGCADINYLAGSGGGGGGAIVIATSGTINVTGSITANGGNAAYGGSGYSGSGGGGSGGAIKIMADIISGNGTISAAGGTGYSGSYGLGGAGKIRLEANTLQRTANTTPSYVFGGSPLAVFPTIVPTLKITKVGGISVSTNPTGAYASPDITLPSTASNPVEVVVEAVNIPVGTTVTITCVPELSASTTATAILSGTQSSSTASAQITISGKSTNVLMATATFTLQASLNNGPFYADGEKVVKMRVASVLGGKSLVTYITETGREITANL